MNFSIYCDESRHLMNDKKNNYMVIGATRIISSATSEIEKKINNLKLDHKYFSEIKWKEVSNNNKKFYKGLAEYFFLNSAMDFRCVVIDKREIDNIKHNQTDEEFFYKMYFTLLRLKVKKKYSTYSIFIDKKDCHTEENCLKIQEFLENETYSYSNDISIEIKPESSKNSLPIQLTDFFIGAVGYQYNGWYLNQGKVESCNNISKFLGIESLCFQKKKFDIKFDIFELWKSLN